MDHFSQVKRLSAQARQRTLDQMLTYEQTVNEIKAHQKAIKHLQQRLRELRIAAIAKMHSR